MIPAHLHRLIIASLVLATLFSSIVPSLPVGAAPTPPTSPQALEIAPPVVTVTAKPGEVLKATITIRNVANASMVAKNEINDFTAAGEDGTPKLLLDENQTTPYSMKAWIARIPQMTLKPKELVQQPVTIAVPANASPGGYYAVIRFTATPAGIDTSGVSLSASLGALILLRVQGDAKEAMSIVEFSAAKNGVTSTLFESTPLRFIARIRNDGNIHEQPVGRIVIKDMFGRTTAGVNVNLDRRNVLPQSIRKFDTLLDKSVLGNKFMFGRYTAQLTFTYGDKNLTTSSNLTFWILPWKLLLAIVVGLVLLGFLLRTLIRRYNNYIVRRSRRRR